MKNKGFTIVEVLIAMALLVIFMLPLFKIQQFMSLHSTRINEQAYATQKAVQMMEELRALVSGSEKMQVAVLDDYDNGATYSTILTTDRNVTDPASSPSNNLLLRGNWKYVRRVTVVNVPEEPFARKVYVRVYKNTGASPEVLAETISVLKTISAEYLPSQSIDLYIICVENIPGWWTSLFLMRPMFESVIHDLQTRCPGLEINTHWITRLGYGRDRQYVPYINVSTAAYTNDVPMPFVYFYPGLMRKSDNSDFNYYDPDIIQGVLNTEGTVQNPGSYAICDTANHGVRYPDEDRLYNDAVAQAHAAGLTPPEISLRMLLEKMNSSPTALKNMVLVNLHGELLPLPPMRNYSDAAKSPLANPGVRVVAHPEQIQYVSGALTRFRVYAYVTSPDSVATTASLPALTVYFPDITLLSSKISVDRIVGNGSTAYARNNGVAQSTYTYNVSYPASGGTLLTFFNTPLRHAANGNYGIDAASRLYGYEYIPCPLSPGGGACPSDPIFTDLTWNNAGKPKNTARWIVTVSSNALSNGCCKLETRIGTDLTTGVISNDPPNLSRTYVWVGVTPPVTEQYQFIGDPRHMPYIDVKNKNGYNWYFKYFDSTAYKGYPKVADGWGDDTLDIDVPRYFQMYRQGLLNTQAIWTAMSGFSFYYYGLGGEFGNDQEPFPSGIPFRKLPWSTSGDTSFTYVDEILPYAHGAGPLLSYSRIVAKTDNTWYSKYWLGELYPDSDYSIWASSGNLPTGAGKYYRTNHNTFADLGRTRTVRTGTKGCTSFLDGNPSSGSGSFKHVGDDTAVGSITTLGTKLSAMFNFPLLDTISAPRPFTLNYVGDAPTEWSDPEYTAMRTTLSIPQVSSVKRIYYDSDYSASYNSSAALQISSGTNTAYLAVSGLSIQANFGTAELGKYALISSLRSFMDAGQYTGQNKISQIPLVNITSPTAASSTLVNPTIIPVKWGISWVRWDNENYTEEYPNGYSEATPLVYSAKYSNDGGHTWYYCSDGVATAPGDKDYPAHTTSLTSANWDATAMPRGSYIIRVECYRQFIDLHYCYDQIRIYINR